jgi:hypothetical protein
LVLLFALNRPSPGNNALIGRSWKANQTKGKLQKTPLAGAAVCKKTQGRAGLFAKKPTCTVRPLQKTRTRATPSAKTPTRCAGYKQNT